MPELEHSEIYPSQTKPPEYETLAPDPVLTLDTHSKSSKASEGSRGGRVLVRSKTGCSPSEWVTAQFLPILHPTFSHIAHEYWATHHKLGEKCAEVVQLPIHRSACQSHNRWQCRPAHPQTLTRSNCWWRRWPLQVGECPPPENSHAKLGSQQFDGLCVSSRAVQNAAPQKSHYQAVWLKSADAKRSSRGARADGAGNEADSDSTLATTVGAETPGKAGPVTSQTQREQSAKSLAALLWRGLQN